MISLQTHSYDGKFREYANSGVYGEMISKASDTDLKIKVAKFDELIEKINATTNKYKPTSITSVNLIKSSISSTANYDASNNLRADNLLYVLCENDKIELDVLMEQLSDIITSGQCPQGRVHRLWQLVCCL